MKNNVGFTLVELIIVVALIGIMAFFAAPEISNWRTKQDLRAAAQTFYGNLQRAKVAAIKDNDAMAIEVTVAGKYTFENDETIIEGSVAEVDGAGGETRTTTVEVSSDDFPINDVEFTSRGLVQTKSTDTPLGDPVAVTFTSSSLSDAGDPQYTVTITSVGGIVLDKGTIE